FEPGTRLVAPGQDLAPVDVVGDAPDDARWSRIDTEPVPLGEELAPRAAELADLEHAIAKRALGVLLPDPRRLANVPVGVEDVRHVTAFGSYRIATAPEPSSSRSTSFKSRGFDNPSNNVGPWPTSLGCTTNSYSSINPSSANASGSFTPPTNSPLPDSRLSC